MERSVHSSGGSEQAVDEDAIRAAITEQCIRKEPAPSNSVYTEQAWQETFERRWIVPDARYLRSSTEVAGGGGHIFCRACVQPKKHGKMAVFKLHVTLGPDPMKVAKYGIITLECHGCGFEQIVPRKPRLGNVAGAQVDAVWMDEYASLSQEQLDKIVREMEQRHVGKAQALGSMYGMGQQALQQNYGALEQRMAAMQAQDQRNALMNQIGMLRERGLIDEGRLQDVIQHHLDEANRRVNVAVAPPVKATKFKP